MRGRAGAAGSASSAAKAASAVAGRGALPPGGHQRRHARDRRAAARGSGCRRRGRQGRPAASQASARSTSAPGIGAGQQPVLDHLAPVAGPRVAPERERLGREPAGEQCVEVADDAQLRVEVQRRLGLGRQTGEELRAADPGMEHGAGRVRVRRRHPHRLPARHCERAVGEEQAAQARDGLEGRRRRRPVAEAGGGDEDPLGGGAGQGGRPVRHRQRQVETGSGTLAQQRRGRGAAVRRREGSEARRRGAPAMHPDREQRLGLGQEARIAQPAGAGGTGARRGGVDQRQRPELGQLRVPALGSGTGQCRGGGGSPAAPEAQRTHD